MEADVQRAAALFGQACDGGDANACSRLGVMVETGQGVTADAKKASALFAKACDGKDAYGCSRIDGRAGAVASVSTPRPAAATAVTTTAVAPPIAVRPRSWTPPMLIGGSVVLGGLGGFLLWRADGQLTKPCTPTASCSYVRSSDATVGPLLVAVAVALLLVGVVWRLVEPAPRDSRLSFSVGPQSIALVHAF